MAGLSVVEFGSSDEASVLLSLTPSAVEAFARDPTSCLEKSVSCRYSSRAVASESGACLRLGITERSW